MLNSLLITLLFSYTCLAQDFALDKESGKVQPKFLGQIKLIQGKTFKRSNGELLPVSNGARFYPSDVVVTAEDSKVRILMVDETSLILGPQSELQFNEYKFKDKNDRKGIFTLVKGQLSANVKHEVKSGEITLKTRFVSMGVRGTELLINHRSIDKKEVSEFALLTGKADLSDSSGKVVKLISGMKMTFVQDKSLEEALSESEKAKLLIKVNEDNEFKNLLPYADIEKLKKEAKLANAFTETSESSKTSPDKQVGHPSPKNHWKDNLKMLNERLKKDRLDESH